MAKNFLFFQFPKINLMACDKTVISTHEKYWLYLSVYISNTHNFILWIIYCNGPFRVIFGLLERDSGPWASYTYIFVVIDLTIVLKKKEILVYLTSKYQPKPRSQISHNVKYNCTLFFLRYLYIKSNSITYCIYIYYMTIDLLSHG